MVAARRAEPNADSTESTWGSEGVRRELHADPGTRPTSRAVCHSLDLPTPEGWTTARCRYPSSNWAQNGGRVLATSNAVTSTSRISMPRSGA